jgi:hypothetical protein
MPLHPEEVLATKDRLARPSPWVTSFFLLHDSLTVGERGFSQVVIQLHQLTGLITPACDRYVQCLLVGANPSVFNTQRRWLQPWSCRLSIYHSRTFPTSGLHFPPKSPARSQVIQSTITKRSKEGTNHNSHEWETPLDFNHKLSSKHSVC